MLAVNKSHIPQELKEPLQDPDRFPVHSKLINYPMITKFQPGGNIAIL